MFKLLNKAIIKKTTKWKSKIELMYIDMWFMYHSYCIRSEYIINIKGNVIRWKLRKLGIL